MKKLCIQVCHRAQLTVEVTEEMERDFYECWDMAEHGEEFKDCETCSWYKLHATSGASLCQIVEERSSIGGKICYD